MRNFGIAGIVALLVSLTPAAALPAPTTSPLAGLHGLVGTWKCTFHGGGMNMAYDAVYAVDLGGHTLRETTNFTSGGDEEVIAYDATHHGWTAAVLDAGGTATVMHAPGSDPKHIAYRSVYPDASLAVMFDQVSPTKYTQHGTYRTGGKTIVSVDTCTR